MNTSFSNNMLTKYLLHSIYKASEAFSFLAIIQSCTTLLMRNTSINDGHVNSISIYFDIPVRTLTYTCIDGLGCRSFISFLVQSHSTCLFQPHKNTYYTDAANSSHPLIRQKNIGRLTRHAFTIP